MTRRWHVEHRDGRNWTGDELARLNIPYMEGHLSADRVLVDERGDPLLMNWGLCVCCYADEATEDMVVVWDG